MPCISPVYISGIKGVVPCGKCYFCLDRRRKDWAFRLRQEDRHSLSSYFVTLTYAPEHLPWTPGEYVLGITGRTGWSGLTRQPTLVKRHVQLWMKKVRKRQAKVIRRYQLREERPIRFYLVGEYGTQSNRPHYHAIMFNVLPQVIAEAGMLWDRGFVDVGTVTPASINYVAGYVMCKPVDIAGRAKPFATMSNRPGIGSGYLKTHRNWHHDGNKFYVQDGQFKGAIPRYYKERLFTKAMRERAAVSLTRLREAQEVDELLELCEFHHDPWQYRIERTENAYALMGQTLIKHNELKRL